MKSIFKVLFFVALSFSLVEAAHSYDQLEFRSQLGSFNIENKGGKHLLNSKSISLGTFSEFIPLFSKQLFDDCGPLLKKKPDLTVRMRSKDQSGVAKDQVKALRFYIEEKQVSDGDKCLAVGGVGIYYIPLHASWFSDEKNSNIDLGTQVKIEKAGEEIGTFKMDENDWVDAQDDQFVNWDFVERFLKSLQKFSVDYRLHPAAGKDKPSLKLISSKGTYEFYKVDHNLWAVKLPKVAWLVASKEWAFWQDMDDNNWKDRFEVRLRIVLDSSKPLPEREAILKELTPYWSASIKRSLHKLILNPNEEQSLKDGALRLLKQKPSSDNFKVLVQSLKQTENPKFQSEITKVLRIRNPKGPLIDEKDDLVKREKVINEWISWWRTFSKTNK